MSNAVWGAVYAKGLADERRVKVFLREELGMIVRSSSEEQDKFQDIDCFVNGMAVSIKAQHSGIAYGNICFELSQQLTTHKDCHATKVTLAKSRITPEDVDLLNSSESWESSWYQNGRAELYYILQGDTLKIYDKLDIKAYVAAHGWLRIRPLSFKRSSYLGGSYRYCNSLCGYLNINAVKNITHYIPSV